MEVFLCARNSNHARRRIGLFDKSSTSSRSVAELCSLFCWLSCTVRTSQYPDAVCRLFYDSRTGVQT